MKRDSPEMITLHKPAHYPKGGQGHSQGRHPLQVPAPDPHSPTAKKINKVLVKLRRRPFWFCFANDLSGNALLVDWCQNE